MVQRALNKHMEEKLEAELWAAIEKRYPEQVKEYKDEKIEITYPINYSGERITAKVTFYYSNSSSLWAHYEYRDSDWRMVRDWND